MRWGFGGFLDLCEKGLLSFVKMPWGRSSPPQVEFYVCHCRVSKLVHGTGNGTVVAQIEQILNNGGTGLNNTKAMANMDTVTGIVAQI